MKKILPLIFLVCFSCVFAQEPVRITQIESDESILLTLDTVKNYIHSISIPFEFEFVNRSSQELWISHVDYYVPNDAAFSTRSMAAMEIKMDGEYTRPLYPDELGDRKHPNPAYYWVGSVRGGIRRDSEIQDSLKHYFYEREPGASTVSAGSLAEFKKRHPYITEQLLKNDTVSFRIYNMENKPVMFLDMPIEY